MIGEEGQDFAENPIIGVDGVGLGALAGPVVVCAAIVDISNPYLRSAIKDSKKLSPKARERVYKMLLSKDLCRFSLGWQTRGKVDRKGPHQAECDGMMDACWQLLRESGIKMLRSKLQIVLDGQQDLGEKGKHLRVKRIVSIPKADSRFMSVGAASIIAKVERDTHMEGLATVYHEYGFDRHKGYGTEEHLAALEEFGICRQHRQSMCKTALRNRRSK